MSSDRPHLVSLFTLGLLALPACSGSSSSTAKAASVDACSLLDAKQVSAEFGVTVGKGQQGNSAGGGEGEGSMTTCRWIATADTNPTPTLTLIVYSWPAGSKGAQNYLDAFRQPPAQAKDFKKPEPVKAVGDEAIWAMKSIVARKGDVSISLNVYGLDQSRTRPASVDLANQALDKL